MSEFDPLSGMEPEPGEPAAQVPETTAAPLAAQEPAPAATAAPTGVPMEDAGGGKRRIWIPLAIAGAAVAVLIVCLVAIFGKASPETMLSRAAAKTGAAAAERLGDSPLGAVSRIGKSLADGSVRVAFDYDDGYDPVSGQVSLANGGDQGVSLGADVNLDGQNVDASLYFNDEFAALHASWLPDCYGITYATFEEDLRASALPDMFELSESDIRELADQIQSLSEAADTDSLAEQMTQLGEEWQDQLTYTAGKEETQVGGQTVTCKTVSATFTSQQFRRLLEDYMDLLSADTAALAAAGGVDPAAALDEVFAGLDCDVQTTSYIYEGYLVKVLADLQLAVDGESAAVRCILDLGCDPGQDDWSFRCDIDADGKTGTLELLLETEADRNDLTVTMGQDDWEETETVSLLWNEATGQLTLDWGTGAIYGTLAMDDSACTLVLDDFGDLLWEDESLYLEVTADRDAQVTAPEFRNLDQWDEDVLMELQEALITLLYGGY